MKSSMAFVGTGIIVLALLFAGCVKQLPPIGKEASEPDLKSFSSWNEISSFLESSSGGYRYYGSRGGMMLDMLGAVQAKSSAESGAAPSASDYSQTNVQVEGVDEPDIVKNDGKYIYAVPQQSYYGGSGQGKVVILRAYPPEQMRIVSEISVGGGVQEIFVYKDKLVVFGSEYRREERPPEPPVECLRCVVPPYYSQNFGFMKVYDMSDRSSPKLEKTVEVKGNYQDSRMVDGKVYAIFTDWADWRYPIPLYEVDGKQKQLNASEVSYFDWPDDSYNYNIFIGLDLSDLEKEETRKVVLMGYSQNLFVSRENMYVTYTRYDYYSPSWKAYDEVYGALLPTETRERVRQIDSMNLSDWRKDRLKSAEAAAYVYNDSNYIAMALRPVLQAKFYEKAEALRRDVGSERTVVNKIALSDFDYKAKGEVPGHVLNQFSMDESGGYFRVATTTGQLGGWGRLPIGQAATSSGLYVLDSELKTVGKIEGIAPGESIYSVRFMGNRAYMVTFKKVDPFFVLDLSDPENPKLLGKLKIPGYSDYLHPYDENYVIGIGKGAVAAEEGDFAWYQGVKLSLFDVRDVKNPKEAAKFEIGDRGTDSYALHEHKAFLFSKERNLLIIPITLAQIDRGKYAGELPANAYGDFVFQGAYVFRVSPEEGFALRGRVSHADEEEFLKSGEYFWSNSNVKRSLYMDGYLYTVSDRYVKANELSSLAPISSVQISEANAYPQAYYK